MLTSWVPIGGTCRYVTSAVCHMNMPHPQESAFCYDDKSKEPKEIATDCTFREGLTLKVRQAHTPHTPRDKVALIHVC